MSVWWCVVCKVQERECMCTSNECTRVCISYVAMHVRLDMCDLIVSYARVLSFLLILIHMCVQS
jgi:hypothetical protein